MDAAAFSAVVAPAGTPKPVVAALNKAIDKVLHNPTVAQKLKDASVEPMPLAPEQFEAMVSRESTRWHKLIREQGIAVD